MAELLLELFSEEIPARMQARAAEDLKRLIVDGLKAQGLAVGEAHAFSTPRRLALVIDGVPDKSPAMSEERKGPRVGAPEAAIQGFLKGAGLKSIGEATVVPDPKKGDYYVAKIDKPGRRAAEIIAAVVPEVLARFPWPKSMRWASHSFTWVRPLHSIVCLLDGKVVPFEVAGIKSGNTTRGHRFDGNEPFDVSGFADYGKKLRARKVLLPASERAEMIREQALALAGKHKLELVADEALLAENAGLTEWPTVLMGHFDEDYLKVPAECLITAMKNHQKCFSLRHPRTAKLANRFLLVSNLSPPDGGARIVAGNEKVIDARLADARFFWEQDLKRPLDEMASALDGITFHEKLGTQKERVERIAELAFQIAGAVDADPADARRAAQLCKADLVSGMVGEFPELQGTMGRYYAQAAGTKPEIARAIELHYKPRGPNDTVPLASEGDAVAIAVALADKLDTLVGFWAIGEKPTGSGDPYQLRRAALGVIRIVLENDLRLPLVPTMQAHLMRLEHSLEGTDRELEADTSDRRFNSLIVYGRVLDLLSFFADRLKVHLREKGARHDLIDAVFSLGGQDDLALIVKRVEALSEFLKTDDGASLLIGVKRAVNIIRDEEKRDKRSYAGEADPGLLEAPEELALDAAIEKVKEDTRKAIEVENFAGAMRALAELRRPVDAFFDKVTVNTDNAKLRVNRLHLLSEIRAATLNVADFSRIAG
ncbi:MAG TPA: glycine--tRNA ligase subunit beta [Hyphomicrobiaceae bacterium]|nr:glycine--tRNA ligase subunit beta [Hyphomicrobiaceae bacterium]